MKKYFSLLFLITATTLHVQAAERAQPRFSWPETESTDLKQPASLTEEWNFDATESPNTELENAFSAAAIQPTADALDQRTSSAPQCSTQLRVATDKDSAPNFFTQLRKIQEITNFLRTEIDFFSLPYGTPQPSTEQQRILQIFHPDYLPPTGDILETDLQLLKAIMSTKNMLRLQELADHFEQFPLDERYTIFQKLQTDSRDTNRILDTTKQLSEFHYTVIAKPAATQATKIVSPLPSSKNQSRASSAPTPFLSSTLHSAPVSGRTSSVTFLDGNRALDRVEEFEKDLHEIAAMHHSNSVVRDPLYKDLKSRAEGKQKDTAAIKEWFFIRQLIVKHEVEEKKQEARIENEKAQARAQAEEARALAKAEKARRALAVAKATKPDFFTDSDDDENDSAQATALTAIDHVLEENN